MTETNSTSLVTQLSPQLNGKQRQHLRQLGHHLQPVVLIGSRSIETNSESGEKYLKAGVLDNATQALLSHELIKVKVHEGDDMDFVARELHRQTNAQLAQKIGKNLLFYKKHPEKPKITLPKG